MTHYLILFLKGIAMGAANVIPGVSGGTIAFVTGIYEEFIDALKSFDLKALKLGLSFKLKELAVHINLKFLVTLFAGVALSLFTLGKVLDWLFTEYPVFIWSFFFGLILASIYYVAKNIKRWSAPSISSFAIGVVLALALAFIKPAEENASFFYLSICGVVAICSMILPGLSGSFVLILMGNYQLIMLQAVPDLNVSVILPVAVGAAVGFIGLSHIISYFLRHFHDTTLSLLTGFILGSLVIIWPWKDEVHLSDSMGNPILKKGEFVVQGYDWNLPDLSSSSTWLGIILVVAGIISVSLLERMAPKK